MYPVLSFWSNLDCVSLPYLVLWDSIHSCRPVQKVISVCSFTQAFLLGFVFEEHMHLVKEFFMIVNVFYCCRFVRIYEKFFVMLIDRTKETQILCDSFPLQFPSPFHFHFFMSLLYSLLHVYLLSFFTLKSLLNTTFFCCTASK